MKFLLKFIFFAVILSHQSFAMAEKKNIQEEFSQGIALIKSKDYNQAKLIFTHLASTHKLTIYKYYHYFHEYMICIKYNFAFIPWSD